MTNWEAVIQKINALDAEKVAEKLAEREKEEFRNLKNPDSDFGALRSAQGAISVLEMLAGLPEDLTALERIESNEEEV